MSFFNVPVRNFGLQKQVTFPKWRIVRGDRVGIIAGKDKGKQGTVLRVYRKKEPSFDLWHKSKNQES